MRTQDRSLTRRSFLAKSALAAGGLALAGHVTAAQRRRTISANDKLNIGFIGVDGQARFSIENLKDQNIVALCDVDANRLARAAAVFPNAKTYQDFRKLIDQDDIEAIVVATPDHTHAVATAAVLRSGRDVYCEKPLTHTVSEARLIADLARKQNAVTQIGTQIHAGNNYRRVVELIQSGAIGPVKEVHVWQGSVYGGTQDRTTGEWHQMEKPATAPVPANLDWDLWLGPVPEQAYSPAYVPAAWRNWWVFGGGTLADFGCHYMDLPFWALKLKYPTLVEPVAGPAVHPLSTPYWLIMRYTFPASEFGTKEPLKLTWYHGAHAGKHPDIIPPELQKAWSSGVLFIGEKGKLLASYSKLKLLPEDKFTGFTPPAESIPNSIGHHKEWVHAIKTRGPTTCHFGYSGPLTETALLGNVAFRLGKKLEWDAEKLKATNCPEAEELVQHHYRPGWKI